MHLIDVDTPGDGLDSDDVGLNLDCYCTVHNKSIASYMYVSSKLMQ